MTAYSELDLFCIIMIGLMFVITNRLTRKTGRKLSALVGAIVICYCIYLLTDFIWLAGDHYGKLTNSSRYIVRCLGMAVLGIPSVLWLIHACNEMKLNISGKPVATALVILPAAFLTFLAVSAPWNNLLFSINAKGDYIRGPMFGIFSLVSYLCVAIAAGMSLVDIFRS